MPNRVIEIDKETLGLILPRGIITLIDAADYDLAKGYSWCATAENSNLYAQAHDIGKGRGSAHLRLHRLILGITDPRIHADHLNGIPLDNRRSNLRVVTSATNALNKATPKNNTSGFKGVSRDANGKYRAYICFQRKITTIGRFDTAEEAAIAYNKKALELHGQFARLNPL